MPKKSKTETRRSIEEQKPDFLSAYYSAIRTGNEQAFRLLLRSWQIEEGSNEWVLAWEAWREELAARALKRPKGSPRPSGSSPRAPRA
jgi:hypothetical protein